MIGERCAFVSRVCQKPYSSLEYILQFTCGHSSVELDTTSPKPGVVPGLWYSSASSFDFSNTEGKGLPSRTAVEMSADSGA
jgi:hypothetical protein